jgi:uridine monophosphate synthetase
LKSGKLSPIYLDLRRLVSYPQILKRVARAYANVLRDLEYDRIAGIPYAALPIATAASMELNKPLIYPRREVKEYGTKAAIEGEYNAGETVVVLDDLTTTGETKFEAIEKLTSAGLNVRDIVVLIDRGQGAKELLARAGYTLRAVTTLPQLLEIWRASNAITQEQYDEVKKFLAEK